MVASQLSTSHPKTDFQLFRTPSSLAGRLISNFAFFDLVIFWTCERTISLHASVNFQHRLLPTLRSVGRLRSELRLPGSSL